jgi:hypothetical protein
VFSAGPDPKQEGEFKVSTREYSYRLLQRVDVASREILACHGHPHDSELRDPHLHIRSIPRVQSPTSRVCTEDFVCLVIKYYGQAKDETLRVDSHFGKEQEGIREDGDVESSPSCLAVDMVLTHYRESATRSFISFMP